MKTLLGVGGSPAGPFGPSFAALVIRGHLAGGCSPDLDGLSGQEPLHATTTFDVNRRNAAGLSRQSGSSSADPQVQALAAVHERELDRAESFRPVRAEHQPVVTCF